MTVNKHNFNDQLFVLGDNEFDKLSYSPEKRVQLVNLLLNYFKKAKHEPYPEGETRLQLILKFIFACLSNTETIEARERKTRKYLKLIKSSNETAQCQDTSLAVCLNLLLRIFSETNSYEIQSSTAELVDFILKDSHLLVHVDSIIFINSLKVAVRRQHLGHLLSILKSLKCFTNTSRSDFPAFIFNNRIRPTIRRVHNTSDDSLLRTTVVQKAPYVTLLSMWLNISHQKALSTFFDFVILNEIFSLRMNYTDQCMELVSLRKATAFVLARVGLGRIAENQWNHFIIEMNNLDCGIRIRLFLNGQPISNAVYEDWKLCKYLPFISLQIGPGLANEEVSFKLSLVQVYQFDSLDYSKELLLLSLCGPRFPFLSMALDNCLNSKERLSYSKTFLKFHAKSRLITGHSPPDDLMDLISIILSKNDHLSDAVVERLLQFLQQTLLLHWHAEDPLTFHLKHDKEFQNVGLLVENKVEKTRVMSTEWPKVGANNYPKEISAKFRQSFPSLNELFHAGASSDALLLLIGETLQIHLNVEFSTSLLQILLLLYEHDVYTYMKMETKVDAVEKTQWPYRMTHFLLGLCQIIRDPNVSLDFMKILINSCMKRHETCSSVNYDWIKFIIVHVPPRIFAPLLSYLFVMLDKSFEGLAMDSLIAEFIQREVLTLAIIMTDIHIQEKNLNSGLFIRDVFRLYERCYLSIDKLPHLKAEFERLNSLIYSFIVKLNVEYYKLLSEEEPINSFCQLAVHLIRNPTQEVAQRTIPLPKVPKLSSSKSPASDYHSHIHDETCLKYCESIDESTIYHSIIDSFDSISDISDAATEDPGDEEDQDTPIGSPNACSAGSRLNISPAMDRIGIHFVQFPKYATDNSSNSLKCKWQIVSSILFSLETCWKYSFQEIEVDNMVCPPLWFIYALLCHPNDVGRCLGIIGSGLLLKNGEIETDLLEYYFRFIFFSSSIKKPISPSDGSKDATNYFISTKRIVDTIECISDVLIKKSVLYELLKLSINLCYIDCLVFVKQYLIDYEFDLVYKALLWDPFKELGRLLTLLINYLLTEDEAKIIEFLNDGLSVDLSLMVFFLDTLYSWISYHFPTYINLLDETIERMNRVFAVIMRRLIKISKKFLKENQIIEFINDVIGKLVSMRKPLDFNIDREANMDWNLFQGETIAGQIYLLNRFFILSFIKTSHDELLEHLQAATEADLKRIKYLQEIINISNEFIILTTTVLEENLLMVENDDRVFIIDSFEEGNSNHLVEFGIDAVKFASFNSTIVHSKYANQSGYHFDPILIQRHYEYSLLKSQIDLHKISKQRKKLSNIYNSTSSFITRSIHAYQMSLLNICNEQGILIDPASNSQMTKCLQNKLIKVLKKSSFLLLIKWVFDENLEHLIRKSAMQNFKLLCLTAIWLDRLLSFCPSSNNDNMLTPEGSVMLDQIKNLSRLMSLESQINFKFNDFYELYINCKIDSFIMKYTEKPLKPSMMFLQYSWMPDFESTQVIWVGIQKMIIEKNKLATELVTVEEKISKLEIAGLVQKLHNKGSILFYEKSSACAFAIDPCEGPYGMRKRLKSVHLQIDARFMKKNRRANLVEYSYNHFPLLKYLPEPSVTSLRPKNCEASHVINTVNPPMAHVSDWSILGNHTSSDYFSASQQMKDSILHWKVKLIDAFLAPQVVVYGNIYFTKDWVIFEPSLTSPQLKNKNIELETETETGHPTEFIWRHTSIAALNKRRYEFCDIALEIIPSKWSNYYSRLFVFSKQRNRDEFIEKCMEVQNETTEFAYQENRRANQNFEAFSKNSLITANRFVEVQKKVSRVEYWRTKSLWTDVLLWIEGIYTNFEYLMLLNKESDRSPHDIMQYPIMPWAIKDFSSEILNLLDVGTYRNLSLPIGAQTKERILALTTRLKEYEETNGNSGNIFQSPCYFPSYCNNQAIVLHYLYRISPYTSRLLKFQDFNFDLPDRSFHEIMIEYDLSTQHISFVKELIPELYYNPLFLRNIQGYALGETQSGTSTENVQLPKWSKSNPSYFINIHRCSLETKIVKKNLPKWIDLIFGQNQSGDRARETYNLYQSLVYEDFISTLELNCPYDKMAIKSVIRNYGQAPVRIFPDKPHPFQEMVKSEAFEGSEEFIAEQAIPPFDTIIGLNWIDFLGSPDRWSSSNKIKSVKLFSAEPMANCEMCIFAWKQESTYGKKRIYNSDNLNVSEIIDIKEDLYFTQTSDLAFLRILKDEENGPVDKNWKMAFVRPHSPCTVTRFPLALYDSSTSGPMMASLHPISDRNHRILELALSNGLKFNINLFTDSIFTQNITITYLTSARVHGYCTSQHRAALNFQNTATICLVCFSNGNFCRLTIPDDLIGELIETNCTSKGPRIVHYLGQRSNSPITMAAFCVPYKIFAIGYEDGYVSVYDLFINNLLVYSLPPATKCEASDQYFSDVIGLEYSTNSGDLAVARLVRQFEICFTVYSVNGYKTNSRRLNFLVEIPNFDAQILLSDMKRVPITFSRGREGLGVNCILIGGPGGRLIWLNQWTLETIHTFKLREAGPSSVKYLKFLPNKFEIERFYSAENMSHRLILSDGTNIFLLGDNEDNTLLQHDKIFFRD